MPAKKYIFSFFSISNNINRKENRKLFIRETFEEGIFNLLNLYFRNVLMHFNWKDYFPEHF